jgi:uncharacterized iron-regulated membrane protein
MLKGILGFVLFIFFVFVFIGILIGGRIYSTIQKAKKAVQQAAEQQEQQRRTETGRQRQQYSQRQQSHSAQNVHSSQDTYSTQREDEFQSQARRTQTATGETIIDNRHQERENKKIFDDSDGEYVEFEEA